MLLRVHARINRSQLTMLISSVATHSTQIVEVRLVAKPYFDNNILQPRNLIFMDGIFETVNIFSKEIISLSTV